MSKDAKGLTPQEARIQRLAVLREMAEILCDIERDGGAESDNHHKVEAEQPRDETAQAYVKLPLGDATLLRLSNCKEAQTTKQIWDALHRAGRESDSQNPVRSVRQALQKLVVANDDVFHLGWARWHLKSKYTPAKLAKLLTKPPTNGTGGRSVEEHAARTKAGLDKVRARGKKLGATVRIDDAMKRNIQEMAGRKGAHKMSLGEIAKANGIAGSSIYWAFPGGRKAILAWKPAEQPESQKAVAGPLFDEQKQPHVRLVK